jgi:hypothetical protein
MRSGAGIGSDLEKAWIIRVSRVSRVSSVSRISRNRGDKEIRVGKRSEVRTRVQEAKRAGGQKTTAGVGTIEMQHKWSTPI